jgi:hypothetical protein
LELWPNKESRKQLLLLKKNGRQHGDYWGRTKRVDKRGEGRGHFGEGLHGLSNILVFLPLDTQESNEAKYETWKGCLGRWGSISLDKSLAFNKKNVGWNSKLNELVLFRIWNVHNIKRGEGDLWECYAKYLTL